MRHQIEQLRNNVIVCHFSRVGSMLNMGGPDRDHTPAMALARRQGPIAPGNVASINRE
jgi:hypothetical protein